MTLLVGMALKRGQCNVPLVVVMVSYVLLVAVLFASHVAGNDNNYRDVWENGSGDERIGGGGGGGGGADIGGDLPDDGNKLNNDQHDHDENGEDEDDEGSGGESVRDVVDEFLGIVEQYERDKENCVPGVTFNLGEGVITQYGVIRFRQQAELAVNRANFLTRIWKSSPEDILEKSQYFFYTQVRSMVEGDNDVFAAGNCYDYMEFNNFTLFCPFAYRMPNDTIMVKDLSVEYKYLGNESEFFFIPRMNAERKLQGRYNETKGRSSLVPFIQSSRRTQIDKLFQQL